jgi:hypothetical protein
MKTERCSPDNIARICEEPGGWVISPDAIPYIDARGTHYPTRRAAIAAARHAAEEYGEYAYYVRPNGRHVRLCHRVTLYTVVSKL